MEFIQFPAHARAFLARAREHLSRFDETNDGTGIVYAALELRLGIEARCYDYLAAELKAAGKRGPTDYSATRLLAKLREQSPDTDRAVEVLVRSEPAGNPVASMRYTPMTKELANDHGQIAELLHFAFFHRNRTQWMVPMRSKQGRQTLLDWRYRLADVADRLEQVCRGTLLTHPRYTLIDEQPADSDPPSP